MSTDRELIEAAARAIGRRVTGWNTQQGEEVAVLDDGSFWQPLHKNRITDTDGDALRLAVMRGLTISCNNAKAQHGANTTRVWTYSIPKVSERHGDDPYAATRRAIVRAAAALAPPEVKS